MKATRQVSMPREPVNALTQGLAAEQLRLVTTAARLYHTHHARQAEIAEKLGISQAGVSRLLRQAEELGIVRTVVIAPEGLHLELEEGLVDAFGLDQAFVVDAGEDDVPHMLGAAAARFLWRDLAGATVGVTSWSVTLREMARLVEPRSDGDTTHVVEMLGDLGSPMLQHEAALATLQFARALHAEAVFLRTPGVATSPALRDVALNDAHIKRAYTFFDHLDVALVGLGPADFHGPLEEGDNFFSAEQLAQVRKAGAVGQLHQRFIDADGQPIKTPLDDLVVGVSLDQLRKAGRRIVIAGGASKHAVLEAALKGGWIDCLVNDTGSASHLMAAASSRQQARHLKGKI